MSALAFLDLASVFVFALTGALAASRAQLDIVGFLFLSALTAIGGGTVRDVLMNRDVVFWIAAPHMLAVSSFAAVLVFLTAHKLESRLNALVWLDSIALAIAVPAGVAAAMAQGLSAPIVLVMGMITGMMGGLMRDVICNEVPVVLRQGELYATAAFAGSGAALVANHLTHEPLFGLGACALVTWALRAGSLAFGWRLPVYKARPPRR
jgi:uncharacterized membrane protein YeiH